ncbi:DUF6518 family protein [Nocardiopsis sp. NPDC007018]|uniref:DUF6518 family protein n=1 Tax=Nocardiopsis sp. NPDC007018 TaxID=3155721 RepID=UPI0033D0C3AF
MTTNSGDRPSASPTAPPVEDTVRPAPETSPWPRLVLAVAAGFLVGVLTSFGQGLLPEVLSPLANSSGSWSLAALLLASLSPRRGFAVAVGVLALFAMVGGYDVASLLRGFSPSPSGSLFWCTAAVVVGPFLGWGGHALRNGDRVAPLAAGAMSGVLVGEGVYGLTVIADTTPAPYWWGSITLGAALLVWAVVRRFPRPSSALLAAAVCAVVATAFLAVYSQNLISLFTWPS